MCIRDSSSCECSGSDTFWDSRKSVSYTHLDVYKRQVLHNTLFIKEDVCLICIQQKWHIRKFRRGQGSGYSLLITTRLYIIYNNIYVCNNNLLPACNEQFITIYLNKLKINNNFE